ncbi:MAG: putative phage terminase [Amycolatopsis sp.]|uniref:terminase n=1 Tax=Amycolatopsis sp. TaxID=37632 RepID=UPI002618E5B4|nr:terminase [Amycolatopsis sp.]MCU1683004.1 putative phage terminase [Amycolatopsis sp.]
MARQIADPDQFVSLGFDAIDWIEHYLCHGPGDVQGQDLVIDDEMAGFIVKAYRLDPVTGRRKVNRAFLSRPKGRAKSELAGALVCFEALGPCRFDGWDASGEPVGREQIYPFIRCLATEENQSGNTYDNVTAMLEHLVENFGDEFPGIDLGRSAQTSSRIFIEGGGEIVPSTSSGAAKDGGKETFSVFDETHLYVLPELRAMHKTVRRNLVKRRAAEPWSLETSTMYAVGESSVAEATHEYHKAVVAGRVRDGGLLFDHREAPHVEDLHDDDQLMPALEYVYGDAAGWMDLERIASDMREPDTDPADARRYFLNQPGTASAKAFDKARWRELADSRFVVPDKEPIAIGFDGSKWSDSTGFIATHIETGHQWVLGVWESPANKQEAESWEVPEGEVHAVLDDAMRTWRVMRVYADPAYYEETIAAWAGKYGPKVVVEWWTHRPRQMAFALRAYQTAMTGGELSHDGSDVFARHIANAVKRNARVKDDEGKPMWTIQKDRHDSPRKIDLAMAGCLSWEARRDAIKAGGNEPPPSRKTTVMR